MNDIFEMLKKNRLFSELPEGVIKDIIIPNGKILDFKEKTTVFFSQDIIDHFLILVSGKVKLVYYSESGEQDIRNLITAPGIVGIDLICTRTRTSPYQAIAVENSELFSFPSEIILKQGLVPENLRWICIQNLLMLISQVNMQNEYRLQILTRHSIRERVLVYLTMQAKKRNSLTFTIPYSRDEMASFLSVNRSALSHELGKLKAEGIIDFSKNRFRLLNSRNLSDQGL